MRKQLFFITVLVIASLFAGCSKEKEEDPLIGTWESDIFTDTWFGRSTSYNVKGQDIFTFYADKRVEWRYNISGSYIEVEGTYTTQGSSLTMYFPIQGSDQLFVHGPGQTLEITLVATGESTFANVTEQTYLVNGDNLTIESTADVPFLKTTLMTKTVYKRVK